MAESGEKRRCWTCRHGTRASGCADPYWHPDQVLTYVDCHWDPAPRRKLPDDFCRHWRRHPGRNRQFARPCERRAAE